MNAICSPSRDQAGACPFGFLFASLPSLQTVQMLPLWT
jgi:hypothetical protein